MKKNVLAVMVIFGMCSTAALAESANVKDALFYAYKTNVTQPKLDDDSFIRDVTYFTDEDSYNKAYSDEFVFEENLEKFRELARTTIEKFDTDKIYDIYTEFYLSKYDFKDGVYRLYDHPQRQGTFIGVSPMMLDASYSLDGFSRNMNNPAIPNITKIKFINGSDILPLKMTKDKAKALKSRNINSFFTKVSYKLVGTNAVDTVYAQITKVEYFGDNRSNSKKIAEQVFDPVPMKLVEAKPSGEYKVNFKITFADQTLAEEEQLVGIGNSGDVFAYPRPDVYKVSAKSKVNPDAAAVSTTEYVQPLMTVVKNEYGKAEFLSIFKMNVVDRTRYQVGPLAGATGLAAANDTNAPDISNDFYEIAAGGPLIDGKWEGSGVAVKDSKVYNNLKYTITVTQVD